MKRNKIRLLIIIFAFIQFAIYTESEYDVINKKRVSQIINDPYYLVTPGDTFSLKFILPSQSSYTTVNFCIDGDYWTNLSFFGKINVEGHTYSELQQRIENIILHEYPKAFPQVLITNPGEFSVVVKGEVNRCREIKAWGFTKLSDIFSQVKTDFSSYKKIEIIHSDGTRNFFDLQLSDFLGQMEQDPYVKRNDTIVLHKKFGSIIINGQVHRPGTYEFIEGDCLDYIVDFFCKGFLPLADTDRIQLKRYISDEHKYGETQYLCFNDIKNFKIRPLDQLMVPQISDYQPKVYFQGAIGSSDVSNKIPIDITIGDKLSFVVRKIEDKLNLSSDIENALLSRKGVSSSLQINLRDLLDNEEPFNDVILQDGDNIVIPFRQYKVFVTGQVTNPGAYPYIANRTWEYYVGLAGGFNMENHIGKKVKIRDVYGNKYKQKERIIEPEDVIYAPLNHPMYYVREYGTDVALISTAIIGTATLIYKLDQIGEGNAGEVLNPED